MIKFKDVKPDKLNQKFFATIIIIIFQVFFVLFLLQSFIFIVLYKCISYTFFTRGNLRLQSLIDLRIFCLMIGCRGQENKHSRKEEEEEHESSSSRLMRLITSPKPGRRTA